MDASCIWSNVRGWADEGGGVEGKWGASLCSNRSHAAQPLASAATDCQFLYTDVLIDWFFVVIYSYLLYSIVSIQYKHCLIQCSLYSLCRTWHKQR